MDGRGAVKFSLSARGRAPIWLKEFYPGKYITPTPTTWFLEIWAGDACMKKNKPAKFKDEEEEEEDGRINRIKKEK